MSQRFDEQKQQTMFLKIKICCFTVLYHQLYLFGIWIKAGVANNHKIDQLISNIPVVALYIELWVKYFGPNSNPERSFPYFVYARPQLGMLKW